MRSSAIILVSVLLSASACKDCNCPTTEAGFENFSDNDTSQTQNAAENGNDVGSTASGSRGSSHNRTRSAGNESVTGGVGNADAETGTTENGTNGSVRNKSITQQPADTSPKPKGIGTRRTRGAGTGTQNGRQL